MDTNFAKNTDAEIKSKIQEWSDSMFTHTKKGADINSVMLYTPLIQMAQNELTGRLVKRTTMTAIGVAALSLIVSGISLAVALSDKS